MPLRVSLPLVVALLLALLPFGSVQGQDETPPDIIVCATCEVTDLAEAVATASPGARIEAWGAPRGVGLLDRRTLPDACRRDAHTTVRTQRWRLGSGTMALAGCMAEEDPCVPIPDRRHRKPEHHDAVRLVVHAPTRSHARRWVVGRHTSGDARIAA